MNQPTNGETLFNVLQNWLEQKLQIRVLCLKKKKPNREDGEF